MIRKLVDATCTATCYLWLRCPFDQWSSIPRSMRNLQRNKKLFLSYDQFKLATGDKRKSRRPQGLKLTYVTPLSCYPKITKTSLPKKDIQDKTKTNKGWHCFTYFTNVLTTMKKQKRTCYTSGIPGSRPFSADTNKVFASRQLAKGKQ